MNSRSNKTSCFPRKKARGRECKKKREKRKERRELFSFLCGNLEKVFFSLLPESPARERRASPTVLFAQSPFFRPQSEEKKLCGEDDERESVCPSSLLLLLVSRKKLYPSCPLEGNASIVGHPEKREEVFVVEEGPQLRFNFGGSPRSREEEGRALDSSPSLAPTPN